MAVKFSSGGDEQQVGSGEILVKNRYVIQCSNPDAAYDAPTARAYKTVHVRDKTRNLIAFICDPRYPPRLGAVSALHRVDHRNYMRVVDWDIVEWPGAEGRRYPAIICERPKGKPLSSIFETGQPLSEEVLIRAFIQPIVNVLRDIHNQGVFHGRIRPENIYFDNEAGDEFLLGECCTAPQAMFQSATYLTIPACQCSPAGRGSGSALDDFYALGVTILAASTGMDPAAKFETEEAAIQAKLSYGTYSALVGSHRVSTGLMEPLRGLLSDDPDERWVLDDVALWLDGRRLSPKQHSLPDKGSRALKFAGEDLNMAREVAYCFARNWEQAKTLVQDGTLDTWLRRSLSDEDRTEAVNVAKGVDAESNAEGSDRMMARTLIALSPDRPIQLKEFAGTVDGIFQLVGVHSQDPEMRSAFEQVVAMGLMPFWLEMQSKTDPEHLRILAKLEKLKHILGQTRIGAGLNAIIYQFNQHLPCQSSLFEKDFVPDIDYFLPAMNRAAARMGNEVEYLVDRQIAAFLSVHFKRSLGDEFRDMDAADPPYIGRIAQVSVLAKVQELIAPKVPLPELAVAAVTLLTPAIERFHSHSHRQEVLSKLMKASASGKLKDLLEVIDRKEDVEMDKRSFMAATHEYFNSVSNQIQLYRDIVNRRAIAQQIGGQIAAAIAGILAGLIVSITSIFKFF
ncbi:hypothetical protein [Aestuariispira insulae]|uniref:Protein kinase domain-containing protein n=1 Tax=Aestuariispira insulae TaxID=1461337 RepID=A0A3D9HW44_9PROT|nr:hypothetical protein [Aestuariispira insulae]RED53639.1 hypothetical protein DFP90_101431 [Aestuariispira insulae]